MITANVSTEQIIVDANVTVEDQTIEASVAIASSPVIAQVTVTSGLPGLDGADGADGAPGQGVAVGGTAGQLLAKVDATDYNTEWVDAPTGGGGGGLVQLVTADVTRVADGANVYTNIPELEFVVPGGETKVVLYALYYDEKSQGITFRFSGAGTFGLPGKTYFFDVTQAVGRQARRMSDFFFTPGTPTNVDYLLTDSISSSPINALMVRAVLHAPSSDVTVRVGFKANSSGGQSLELKQGSSLAILN